MGRSVKNPQGMRIFRVKEEGADTASKGKSKTQSRKVHKLQEHWGMPGLEDRMCGRVG